ncbi:MAG: hypothetical protein V8R52_02140 [Coprobacter fastidiosus]
MDKCNNPYNALHMVEAKGHIYIIAAALSASPDSILIMRKCKVICIARS